MVSARGVSAPQLLTRSLAQWQPCGPHPHRATRPWSPPLRPRPVPPRQEQLPRVTHCLEIPLVSPWTCRRLSPWRTCWQPPASAGVADHGSHRTGQQLLVFVRRDLRCPNSRRLPQESRERGRQHLTNNRCSPLNTLPPHRVPPPVPAGIKKAPLRRLKALGVGPLLGGLGKDGGGVSPR